MAARIFSVLGSDEIEVDCPRHGTYVSRNPKVVEALVRVHDLCLDAPRKKSLGKITRASF